jgi:hypothetical protein
MTIANPIVSCEPILDTMIQMAFAKRSHRVIAAGSAAPEIYRGLCRRGFSRVATAAYSRAPGTPHEIALVAGEESIQALEALLIRLMPFLSVQASMATWIDSAEHRRGQRIQFLLEGLGFRVESGAKCEIGFVLAARRYERKALARAA